jgi:hypothetical protein
MLISAKLPSIAFLRNVSLSLSFADALAIEIVSRVAVPSDNIILLRRSPIEWSIFEPPLVGEVPMGHMPSCQEFGASSSRQRASLRRGFRRPPPLNSP